MLFLLRLFGFEFHEFYKVKNGRKPTTTLSAPSPTAYITYRTPRAIGTCISSIRKGTKQFGTVDASYQGGM